MRSRDPGPVPDRRQVGGLALAVGVGALGLVPGFGGAGDPLAVLFWLGLSAPASGVLVGATGLALVPYGFAVQGLLLMGLVWTGVGSPETLATPAWAACAVLGAFALGFAAGRWAPHRAWASAGLFVLGLLVLSGLSVQGGLGEAGTSWARTHPELAARLLDLSPLVFLADLAGRDWVHAHPQVYALSGVEYFPRRPYDAALAGPGLLLVGSLLAWAASRRAFPSA